MIASSAKARRAASKLLGAIAGLVVTAVAVCAQGKLSAHYTISMTGVSIGQIVWKVDIGSLLYTTSATGKASGVLSVLVNGEGSVESRGTVAEGVLTPSTFTSRIVDDDGDTELQVTFTEGLAHERTLSGPPPKPERRPVTDAMRSGVSDPLTAVLIPAKAGFGVLAAVNCDRVLSIYDGRRRYDLVLSYRRIDTFKSARDSSGPALVCGITLRPIAGYKPDSLLMKYVAGRRDMELWFAPIAGTSIMAPIQVSMPTLIGTLKIVADQFETAMAPAAPP